MIGTDASDADLSDLYSDLSTSFCVVMTRKDCLK